MNIVFFGSSHFAECALRALLGSQHKVCCVVTQPDKKKGRGLHLSSTVIKRVAKEYSLKIYQPLHVNILESVRFLKKLDADLFVVVSYGQIFSQEILDIPRIFAVNIHASILPQYRGAAPINRSIINGEKTIGITIFKLTSKMDSGPIISSESVAIEDLDTTLTLEEKLSKLSAPLLLKSLEAIENNNFTLTPQEEEKATFAPKMKREDGLIEWEKSASGIHNQVRGCINWPGAFTHYKDKLLKIYKTAYLISDLSEASHNPGEIIGISKKNITVSTGKGNLIIEELQIEGKRRMSCEEFIAGHKMSVGEVFT